MANKQYNGKQANSMQDFHGNKQFMLILGIEIISFFQIRGTCHAPFFHNHEQNCSNIIITNEQEGRFQYESIWWVFTIILETNHSVKELDPPVHPRAISLSLSLSKYLDLIFFFALPRFTCAIVSFAASRYAWLLFTRAASRHVLSLLFRVASICVHWIVVFPSHHLFFYSLARLPKSDQKPPKSAKSSFSWKACVCFSPYFSSFCVWPFLSNASILTSI